MKNKMGVAILIATVSLLIAGCTNTTTSSNDNQEVILTSIDVTYKPVKLVYDKNEVIDYSGIYVTGNYSDTSTKQILDYSIYPASGTVVTNSGKTNVTVIAAGKTTSFTVDVKSSIGDVYYVDSTPVGVVLIVNANCISGKIISFDESSCSWAYRNTIGATGTLNLTSYDGYQNMNIIKSLSDWSETNYPAFYWCNSLGRGSNLAGFSDWYIPVISDLSTITKNLNAINAGLNSISGSTPISLSKTYWSSFDGNSLNSYTYNNGTSQTSKTTICTAKAVRNF